MQKYDKNKKTSYVPYKEKEYDVNNPYDMLMKSLEEDRFQSYLPNPNKLMQNQGFQDVVDQSLFGYKEPIQQEEVNDVGSLLGYLGQEAMQAFTNSSGNMFGGMAKGIDVGLDSPIIDGILFNNPIVSGAEKAVNAAIDLADPKNELDISFKDSIQKALNKYSDNAFEFANAFQDDKYVTDNDIIKFAGNVSSGVGGMVPQIATSLAAGPTASMASLIAQSFGSGYNEAINDGAEENKAILYGLANAGIEAGTEKLTGGLDFFGKGALDDIIDSGISKISNNYLRKGAKVGADMLGEGLEEYISGVAGEFTPDIYKEYEGNENILERLANVQPEALYSGAVGGVTAGVLNTPSYIVNGIEPKPVINKEFLEKNRTPVQQETKQNATLQTNNVVNPVQENIAETALKEPNIETAEEVPLNEGINEQVAQATVDQQQSTINENIAEGLKSDNDMIKMEAQRVNSEKIKNSAKLYKVDTETANRVSEVSNALGVQVEFVDQLDHGAEGAYKDGVIYISKDTVNPVQQVYKHELTHHLETTDSYNEFKDTVLQLMKLRNVDVDSVRNNIRQNYLNSGVDLVNEADIDSEMVSIFTQDGIFQDKNTIDDIANININVAQKIWNWIKEKVYSFAPGSTEKAMLLKAERLYREAIDQANKKSAQTNASGNTKLSLGTNVDVITDSKNPDYYKYDNLIKLNDIKVPQYSSLDLTSLQRSDVLRLSKERAIQNGAIDFKDGNSYFVYNNGDKIRVNKTGLLHRKYNDKLSNRRLNVIVNAGELLQDAIKINEVYRDGKTSNIYFSKYYQDGNPYVARFVVVNNELNNIDNFRLYSLSTRKGSSRRPARANSSFSGVGASSMESVNDFLRDVNDILEYKNDLPLDVYYRLNEKYLSTPYDLEGHKYSFGTSLNRLDSSKELKAKVAGYNALESNYKKKIVGTVQDEYRGSQIDDFLNYAADETLRTGSISKDTRQELINELINENYRLIEDPDDTYNELVNYFDKVGGINIDQSQKSNALRILNNYGYTNKSKKANDIGINFNEGYDQNNFYLDKVYQELSELLPGRLPEAVNLEDQLQAIMNLAEETKPGYEKVDTTDEFKKYIQDEVNQLLDDYQYEVIYRSEKSNYDKYVRKLADERGKFNSKTNTDILANSEALAEDFEDFKKNIDSYIDSVGNKYSDMRPYVSIMKDYKSYNKTISQVNDVVANKDKNIRKYLYDHTEKLVFDAGKQYADGKTENFKKLHDIVEKYGIKPGSKESAALQRFGEGFYQKRTKEKINIGGKEQTTNIVNIEKYGLEDLKKDIPDVQMQKNIIAADKEIRKIYDDYAKRMNKMLEGIYSEKSLNEEAIKEKDKTMLEINSLRKTLEKLETSADKTPMLLAQINKVKADIRAASNRYNNIDQEVRKNKRLNLRENYYHHFNESSRLFDIFKNREIKINNELSGISEFTKPKAKWQSWMQERNNFGEYKEDAIGGLLKYIDEAENAIAFDPVINELRDFNKALVKYSNEEQINNGNYIEFLNEYTNDIAGKTNYWDRPFQRTFGRRTIKTIDLMNNMVKKNAVYGNFRSAIAQFFNAPNSVALLTQKGGAVKTNLDISKGIKDYVGYIQSKFKGDYLSSPIQQSAFITQRYIDQIDRQFNYSNFRYIKNFADLMMSVGDQTIAEITWFSAYEQGKRLNKNNPIEYADDLTRRAIAGRGIGEVPLLQKSKIVKLVTPFQVEVNNTWNLTKDLVSKKQFSALASMFATTYLMNSIAENIMGARYGIDLVDALMDAFKMAFGDDEEEKGNPVGRVAGEILSNVPYANAITPYLAESYDTEKLFGEADPTRYGQVNLIGDFFEPFIDLANGNNIDYTKFASNLFPGGGKQFDRAYKYLEDKGIIPRVDFSTSRGLQISKKEGAYNDKGQLKYVIDDDLSDNIKGVMFGTYATDAGKEYLDNSYSALSEKKTAAVEKLAEKHELTDVYEAMRHISTIKGISGVDNSKASYVRQYLEEQGLYNDIVKGADTDTLQSWGLNKTVVEMSDSEFQSQLKMLEMDNPTSYNANGIKKIDILDNYVSTDTAAKIVDHIDDIESVKKDGKSISNSKSALIRDYLEDQGIYNQLKKSGSLSELGVSDSVIGMTQAEFDEFIRTKIDPYR